MMPCPAGSAGTSHTTGSQCSMEQRILILEQRTVALEDALAKQCERTVALEDAWAKQGERMQKLQLCVAELEAGRRGRSGETAASKNC